MLLYLHFFTKLLQLKKETNKYTRQNVSTSAYIKASGTSATDLIKFPLSTLWTITPVALLL